MNRGKCATAVAALLIMVAVVRVVGTYRSTAQGFDEPCHVSSAMELLDKGTYTLDPWNTPLARIAIGLPLYFAGVHFPQLSTDDPQRQNYIYVGNKILYGDGHYLRNLRLARYGVLLFLLLSSAVVFSWASREFGNFAAVMSVALYTTLPAVLAFSSIAYSDMAAAFAQTAALFAFSKWLERPSTPLSSCWLGITIGVALLAKFTTLVYLPVAAVSILLCRWLITRKQEGPQPEVRPRLGRQLAIAALLALIVVWGGYAFSIGRVQEGFGLSPTSMPTFQHFPAVLRPVARNLVLRNPPLPAPGLIYGLAGAYSFNREKPPSYFSGRIRDGGWWYFFFVDVGVKSPLPFLALACAGLVAMISSISRRRWTSLAPGISVLAILLATTTTNVYYGIRHIIVVFPMLAIIAGSGAAYLWELRGRWRVFGRVFLATMVLWQLVSTTAARHDYLAYFNELAGRDPSKLFVGGCDLDCGQDLFRLANELHARQISSVSLAVWTSADMDKSDLPAFTIPSPFKPTAGWVVVSLRAMRMGEFDHQRYPMGAFEWLDRYEPVARIGKTMLLYHIPAEQIYH